MKKNIQSPSEIWNGIKGKAHLYQTAFMGTHCVRILKVVQPGTFFIAHPVFGGMDGPASKHRGVHRQLPELFKAHNRNLKHK